MNPFKVGTLRLYYAPRPPQDAAAAEVAAPNPSGAAEPRPGDAHTSGVEPGMTRDGHPRRWDPTSAAQLDGAAAADQPSVESDHTPAAPAGPPAAGNLGQLLNAFISGEHVLKTDGLALHAFAAGPAAKSPFASQLTASVPPGTARIATAAFQSAARVDVDGLMARGPLQPCNGHCPLSRRAVAPSDSQAQDAERSKGEATQTPASQGSKRTRTTEESQMQR